MDFLKSTASSICSASRFGPCSAVSLAKDYPQLVTTAVLTHPHKMGILLLNSEVDKVRALLGGVSAGKLNDVMSDLLRHVSYEHFRSVLVPIVNDATSSGTLIEVMQVLQPGTTVALLNRASPQKVAILLRAPSEVLVSLVSKANSDQLLEVLLPLMEEPDCLLEDKLLPVLQHVEHPEHIAAVVNQVEPDLLFWLLRGSQPLPLVAFLNACVPADFEANGAVTRLLQELADHRGLVRKKVIPLIESSEAEKMAQMVQGVRAEQLLEVLHRVPLDDLVLLLAHTNAELIVRLFNGPLESTLTTVAGITAISLRSNPLAAQTIGQVTDHLTASLQQADRHWDDVKAHADKVAAHVTPVVDDVKAQAEQVMDDVKAQADQFAVFAKAQSEKVNEDINTNLLRGKKERGGSEDDSYKFGDLTRGFFANQVDEVKNIAKLGAQTRGIDRRDSEEYKFGDLTRGMVEMAKGGVSSLMDNLDSSRTSPRPSVDLENNSQTPEKRVTTTLSPSMSSTAVPSNASVAQPSQEENSYFGPSDLQLRDRGDAACGTHRTTKAISQVFENVTQHAKRVSGVLNSCNVSTDPGTEVVFPPHEGERLEYSQ